MLKIGYSGSLKYYHPETITSGHKILVSIKDFFWTYRHNYSWAVTRSPYYLFEAIRQLKKINPDLKNQLKIELWGIIEKKNQELINNFEIADVVTIEEVLPKQASLDKLISCDVLFLPMELSTSEHPTLFIPGKVFEYILMKKPILVLGNESNCIDIIDKSGLGCVASPTDIDDIAKKISWLINNKDNFKRIFVPNENYINSLSFKERTKDLANIFNTVLKEK